jgi:predicted transcriptional regulator
MINRHTVFEIHRLCHEGLSKQRIADTLHVDPKTVTKFLIDPDPKRHTITRPSKLDPFKEKLTGSLRSTQRPPPQER